MDVRVGPGAAQSGHRDGVRLPHHSSGSAQASRGERESHSHSLEDRLRRRADCAQAGRQRARAWKGGANFDTLVVRFHDANEEKGSLQPFPRDSLPASYSAAFSGKVAGDFVTAFPITDRGTGHAKFVIAQILTSDNGGRFTVVRLARQDSRSTRGRARDRATARLTAESDVRRDQDLTRRVGAVTRCVASDSPSRSVIRAASDRRSCGSRRRDRRGARGCRTHRRRADRVWCRGAGSDRRVARSAIAQRTQVRWAVEPSSGRWRWRERTKWTAS